MSNEKLVPRLRFPEFVEDGEWEKNSVQNIFELQDGYPFSSSDFTKENSNSKQVIRITDINNQNNNEEKVYLPIKRIQELDISKFEVKKGDLLLSLTGAAGFNFFIWKTENGFINQRTMKITPIKQEHEALIFLLEPLIHSKINSIGTGQNNNLSKEALLEIEFHFPSRKEQLKLSSFLTNLDEVIAAQHQKIELLKAHKKGLMQQLFPQEGERVPRFRFKEFEKDGEWVSEQFSNLYYFIVTNSLSREFLNYENGNAKNIHYGDIHTKFSTQFDITKEQVPFINFEVPLEKIRKECYCEEGDIVFADASEDLNDIGKCIEIVYLNGEKLISGLHTLLARQINKKLVVGFGGYLFMSGYLRKQIQREAQGAKVLGISGTRISKITVCYPNNPEEQQKIASCLSSLDALITAQLEKLEQLKLHKKGLMQGLFPSGKE